MLGTIVSDAYNVDRALVCRRKTLGNFVSDTLRVTVPEEDKWMAAGVGDAFPDVVALKLAALPGV